jgi:hypothetical protein
VEEKFDARHVVAHSPYLLYKYRCHNCLVPLGPENFAQYICWYICKGHDYAYLVVNAQRPTEGQTVNYDELTAYQRAHYFAAPEAFGRLWGQEVWRGSCSVYELSVHKPSEPLIVYEEGHEVEAAQRAEYVTEDL